jgi:hypothetical protein
MAIAGKYVKRTRIVQTERFVVALEVDAVIPDEDPSEPCYEPETVRLLHAVEQHAEAGDVPWLMKHGRVYERVASA